MLRVGLHASDCGHGSGSSIEVAITPVSVFLHLMTSVVSPSTALWQVLCMCLGEHQTVAPPYGAHITAPSVRPPPTKYDLRRKFGETEYCRVDRSRALLRTLCRSAGNAALRSCDKHF